jgi:hypothetical protein
MKALVPLGSSSEIHLYLKTRKAGNQNGKMKSKLEKVGGTGKPTLP